MIDSLYLSENINELNFQFFHIKGNGDAIHVSNHSILLFRSCIGFFVSRIFYRKMPTTQFSMCTHTYKQTNKKEQWKLVNIMLVLWKWCDEACRYVSTVYDGSCVLKSLTWIKSDSLASKSVYSFQFFDGQWWNLKYFLQNMHMLFPFFCVPSYSRQYVFQWTIFTTYKIMVQPKIPNAQFSLGRI